MNRKELDRIRMLPVLGIVLAVFLAFNISVFATEDGVGDIPAEGEAVEAEVEIEEQAVTTDNLAEPEELLDDYIEVLTKEYAESQEAVSFEPKGGIIVDKLRGAKLKGADKRIYDYLKERIEEVSKGENIDEENEEKNGLTVFTVNYNDIFSQQELATHYTAADIGVDIVADGEITDEAAKAVYSYYSFDMRKVITALLSDCPYQLFWYDKTKGVIHDPEFNLGAVHINGEWEAYCIPEECNITFYFAVSMDYAPELYYGYDFNDDGKLWPIQTDINKIQSLGDAVNNAIAVVTEASDEGTDFDKLDYYREWICNEVVYDNNAMDEEIDTPYGNPWQLIYVFDGKEDTNAIVCEGYSKAFKYLCDLTDTFDDNTIDCRLVSGEMAGGTGAGPHMWNVLETNGKNYLVDVTNCDSGTVGADRKLFMVGNDNEDIVDVTETIAGEDVTVSAEKYTFTNSSHNLSFDVTYTYDVDTVNSFEKDERQLCEIDYPTCAHNWDEGVVKTEPTCIKDGIKTFTCSSCGATRSESVPALEHNWKEATCTAPKTCERCKVTEGKALGHNYSVEVEGTAQDATCTEEGKEADKKCSRCEDVKIGATISALGHDWKDATCTAPKTCERCKETEGKALGHDWKEATCTAPRTCERCKETEGEALGHVWKDATCTTPKTCERCKATEGNALGHKWDGGVVTTAPTVDEQGVRTYTCTVCNVKKTEPIAKLPKPVAVPAGKTLAYNAKAQTGVASGEGYTLSGMSATNAGSYTATAKLKSGYIWKDGTTAEKKISWKINKLAISKASVSGIAAKTYTGKAIAQSPTLKFAGTTLKKGTDYKLSYKNNLKVGRASVTINGCGNFNGSVTKTFNINPKGASLKTPTALKNGMNVYWNKQTAKMSTARITGYQVQIATDANFKKNVKTYTVKGYNSASRKITGLKGEAKYYVRVRTYKTLKISGKDTNFYSGWSGAKNVVTKK